MKKLPAVLVAFAAASVIALSGCQTPTVAEVGPGAPAPRDTHASQAAEETPTEFDSEETTEEAPVEEAPAVATFDQKYTYPDGTEIRFTKITTGKLTKADVEYYEDEFKAGQTYVKFAYKITNGSTTVMDQYAYLDITYGPEGESAESAYLIDSKGSPSGKILPGKSVKGEEVFMIPAKFQGDVVAQIDIASDYEAAIFNGAVA